MSLQDITSAFASTTEGFPSFWQILQMPSLVWICIVGFWKPYIGQVVGGRWDLKDSNWQNKKWGVGKPSTLLLLVLKSQIYTGQLQIRLPFRRGCNKQTETFMNLRQFLDTTFPEWIGWGSAVAWPPRSPDLTPLDFHLWGYFKDQVNVPPLP